VQLRGLYSLIGACSYEPRLGRVRYVAATSKGMNDFVYDLAISADLGPLLDPLVIISAFAFYSWGRAT
jgi:hypothetical protein